MGHKSMEKTGANLVPYMIILLFAGALIIRRFRISDMNGRAVVLLFVFVGFAWVIMQYVNYPTFHRSGAIVLALQGRNYLPVIYAGYALIANYLTSFRSPRINTLVAAFVAAVFIACEFPWFLNHVTESWYFIS